MTKNNTFQRLPEGISNLPWNSLKPLSNRQKAIRPLLTAFCLLWFQQRPLPHQRSGGAGRDRTDDLLLAKQALSQLSYGPLSRRSRRDTTNRNADCGLKAMVGLGRFELPTSRLSGVRSNRLSYRPLKTPKPDQPSTKADLSGANFRDLAACHIQQRHALKASMRKGNEDGGTAIYIVDHSRQQKRCL